MSQPSVNARAVAPPWPVEWEPPVRRNWLVLVGFLTCVTVVIGAAGVVQLLDGDPQGMFILLFTPALGFTVLLACFSRLRGRRAGVRALRVDYIRELREPGIVMPYSAPLTVLYAATMVWMFLACAAVAVLGCWIVFDSGVGIGAVVMIILFGGIAVYAGRFCWHTALGKLARGSVALTPTGVYHRSWAFTSFFPWEESVFVEAMESHGPVVLMAVSEPGNSWFRRASRLWRQEELAFAPHLAIRTMFVAVDPALLYHALRYYHHVPESRKELAGEAGLARLRAAALRLP